MYRDFEIHIEILVAFKQVAAGSCYLSGKILANVAKNEVLKEKRDNRRRFVSGLLG